MMPGFVPVVPNLNLGEDGKLITFLLDSGSQLSVLRKDLLPEDFSYNDSPPGRRVFLKGAFGPEVTAQLLKVEAALSDEFGSELPAVVLNIALCDSLNGNIGLLSMHDYNFLLNSTNIVCPDVKLLNNSGRIVAPYLNLNIAALHDDMILSDNDSRQASQGHRFDNLKLFDIDLTKESPEQFKLEQRDDVTLKPWWLLAANGSKEYIINASNSLLYRNHKIAGMDVFQLVLPESKRQIVMSASHESGWAMHFASAKTIKRIKAYYIWPSMILNVRSFVASCKGCQRRSRINRSDRVPISSASLSHEDCDLLKSDSSLKDCQEFIVRGFSVIYHDNDLIQNKSDACMKLQLGRDIDLSSVHYNCDVRAMQACHCSGTCDQVLFSESLTDHNDFNYICKKEEIRSVIDDRMVDNGKVISEMVDPRLKVMVNSGLVVDSSELMKKKGSEVLDSSVWRDTESNKMPEDLLQHQSAKKINNSIVNNAVNYRSLLCGDHNLHARFCELSELPSNILKTDEPSEEMSTRARCPEPSDVSLQERLVEQSINRIRETSGCGIGRVKVKDGYRKRRRFMKRRLDKRVMKDGSVEKLVDERVNCEKLFSVVMVVWFWLTWFMVMHRNYMHGVYAYIMHIIYGVHILYSQLYAWGKCMGY